MNIKNRVDESICCGCGACAAVCPCEAIQIVYHDKDWHLHPQLDNEKCINCGKCIKVCPAIAEKDCEKFETFGFAAKASDEIRQKSSSGGMFWPIAKHIVDNGGYVAGAVYDENLVVKHIVTNDLESIEKMRGSKYVQSETTDVFKPILTLLKAKKTVLFTGTPCQVAAVRRFVGKYSDNLICVDILCHGTPSPKVFDYYLRENFNKDEIKTVLFRNKEHRNGMPGSLTVVMKDGKKYYSEYFDNSLNNAFDGNLTQRTSCFDCKYAEFPRLGDISIGDFWGAKTTDTKIDYEKGCSVIFVNTKKGNRIFEKVKQSFDMTESYSLETLMSWNRNKNTLWHNEKYEELPSLIEKKKSFRVASDMILNEKYDVGVFGVTMNPNFGGLITYWALYEAIQSLGYRTVLIARPLNAANSEKRTHSTEFFEKHCNVTKQIEHSNLKELNKQIDKFVLGSDQVWNYNLFQCWWDSLYLDFVDDRKMKIAYAASFGCDEHKLPIYKVGQVSKYFKHFDHIGVRESDGVNILKNNYNVDATHVLDPVFLVDLDEYKNLAALSNVDTTSKYVGSYIIEPTDFKLGAIKEIQKKLDIGNINLTDGNRSYFESKSQWFKDREMHIQADATIYDWIKIIKDSDFFVTDSFHAVCFCIMFSKPFVLLQERWALSRIESIMNLFGLHERWLKINSLEDLEIQENWFKNLDGSIKDVLNREVSRSYNWLKNSLSTSKTIREISHFKPHIEKERVEDYFYFLMRERSDYVILFTSCNVDETILSSIDFKSRLSFEKFDIDGPAFAMLYDCGNDCLITKSSDFVELKYDVLDKELICLVDRKVAPFANNIYVFGQSREVAKLNPNSGATISIYSKSQGCLVDSFDVEIKDGTAFIIRK